MIGKSLAAALAMLGLQGIVYAGEPIEFSTSGKKSEHVKKSQTETYLEKRDTFNLKRTSEAVDEVRGGPTPAMINSKRNLPLTREQEDLQSWKNSWIFHTPGTINRQKTAEEVFGVDEFEPDGSKKKKPTAMEQYLKEKEKERKGGQSEEDDMQSESNMGTAMQSKTAIKFNKADSDLGASGNSDRSLRDLFNSGAKNENRSEFSLRKENEALLRAELPGADGDNERQVMQRKERNLDFQQILNGKGNAGSELKVRDSLSSKMFDNAGGRSGGTRILDNLDRLGSRTAVQPVAPLENRNLTPRPGALDSMRRFDTAPSEPAYQPPPVAVPQSKRMPSVLPGPRHNR